MRMKTLNHHVDGVGATVKCAVNTDVLSRHSILVTDTTSFIDSARKSYPNTEIKHGICPPNDE